MSDRSCLIRFASKHEIPDVHTITFSAFREISDQFPPALFDTYIKDLERLVDCWDEAQVMVAEIDGRIVGTVSFYPDASKEGFGLPESWAGFRRLAVHRAARGHGIGRMLANKCAAMARTLGRRTLGIHTASFLSAACKIYEQMGFCRCPIYDRRASEIWDFDEDACEVTILAYQLDLLSWVPQGK